MRIGKFAGVVAAVSLLFAGMSASPANAASTAYYITNVDSNMCIGVGSKRGNGAPAIQWPCGRIAPDMQWDRWQGEANDGTVVNFLRNRYSGKCLGVGSSLANGARAIQWDCNGAVDQKWWYDTTLQNVYSGKCLGTGSSHSRGSQLMQWNCNGAPDEEWRIYRLN
ncbi:RICIN domain-containing protein [Streptomyces sp. NPDC003032]